MKPTDKQTKEFWERLGVKPKTEEFLSKFAPHIPSSIYSENYPPIDLNNLFKYAVPKLMSYTLGTDVSNMHRATAYGGYFQRTDIVKWDEDPALALFWSIYEVVK